MRTEIGTLLDTIMSHANENHGNLTIGFDGSSGWVVEYGYGDPWAPASLKDERFGVAFNERDLNDALMQVVGELPDVAMCLHCGQRIARAEGVWMHLTGRHHGRRSCSPEDSLRPYGLVAASGLGECPDSCPCLTVPACLASAVEDPVDQWTPPRRRRLLGWLRRG